MYKNLLITFGLATILLCLGLFVFMPAATAKDDILEKLLEIPAPPPPNPLVSAGIGNRGAAFFSQQNPPPDNAPIEDLLEYWQFQNSLDPVYNPTIAPSDRVMDRILAEVEKEPNLLTNFLTVLSKKPESSAFLKRMYDNGLNDEEANQYQLENLKQYLTYNSDYFTDDLVSAAEQVRDENEYVTNQQELLALSRVNFERARPILDRLLNDSSQPVSQTLASWALYMNALKEGNSFDADDYRRRLMRVVEDKSALPGNRDLALDALVYGGDFPGRDDWYFGLMEDETLHDLRVRGVSYTGLTTLLMRSPPDKYVDKMIELLKSSNIGVRSAAARNLTVVINNNGPEVAQALLPWLEDPKWVKNLDAQRRLVVTALARHKIPESVPGLISIMNEKIVVDYDPEDYNYGANTYSSNTNLAVKPAQKEKREVFPYRDEAISALIKQENIQAAAALRQVLPEVQPWKRNDVVRAILVSGGYTVAEQMDALEAIAKKSREQQEMMSKALEMANTPDDGEDEIDSISPSGTLPRIALSNSKGYGIGTGSGMASTIRLNAAVNSVGMTETFNPEDAKLLLGGQVAAIGEPGAELVSTVVYRIGVLEKSDPPIAAILRDYMQGWRGEAVYAVLLDDLAKGKSTLDAIVKLLGDRAAIREIQMQHIYNIRNAGNPIAYGISACLLENNREYDAILAGTNDDAKIAMLGCARLVRAKLGISTVAQYLKNPNKTLALAAEKYIESEDSPEARKVIYSLYPNETKVLGATLFFGGDKGLINVNPEFYSTLFESVTGVWQPPYTFYVAGMSSAQSKQKVLIDEIKETPELLAVYAYEGNYVRFYKDGAVFSWDEDEARYRERKMTDYEFNYLKSYMESNDVGNLPPFISNCGGCQTKELLMLGRQGGRRVFVSANPSPEFFRGLESIFEDMKRPPSALKYWLEKDLAGLEILFADEDLEAKAVWKNGDDLRLLVNNVRREEEIEKELNKLASADMENDALDYDQAYSLDRKRRAERALESYSWHRFSDRKLADFSGQPPGLDFLSLVKSGKTNNEYYEDAPSSAVRGNVEVRTVEEALYKIVNGQTTKLKDGYYRNVMISGNGQWVVASKYDEKLDEMVLVRIDLQTKREFPVKIDSKKRFIQPVADVSAVGKMLIGAGNNYDYGESRIDSNAFFLLDTATGNVVPAKGEFRPLMQQTYRDLQKAAAADEVWAAIPNEGENSTELGIYNMKTFVFKSVLHVSRIAFDSMDMWVDEPANKVYIVYNSQLLSIPLKKPEVVNSAADTTKP